MTGEKSLSPPRDVFSTSFAAAFRHPRRLSSEVTYEQRLAQHMQSREDLKHKTSDVSLERGSIVHKKPRSSELKLDVDEQRIYQGWLDTEKEKGLLFDKDYAGHTMSQTSGL